MDKYELSKKWDQKWEKSWGETWEPLLYTDNELDITKIKNEMHDLWFIMMQVSEVYAHITGGLLSKENYYADSIISRYEEMWQEAYQSGYDDCLEEHEVV